VAAQTRSPPYGSYAGLFASFGAGMTGVAALATVLGRRPEHLGPLHLAVLAAATFKDEKPVQTGGPRQAIGELVTCSQCTGAWAAAGFVSAHTLAPRTGRLLTWSLAAAGANDWLQAGFAALTSKANELEQRTSDS